MSGFAIGVALLLALAGGMLVPAFRLRVTGGGTAAGAARDAFAALDRDRVTGQLDDEQHRLAQRELQRRLLDESADELPLHAGGRPRRLALVLAVAMPLFAVGLYAVLGNPGALSVTPPAALRDADVTPEALDGMLASLAQRLEKPSGNPASDLQGWTMLARSYAALQRFADADRAYARAIALSPRDAQLLADRADVLAVVQGQRTAGEPERLIAEALAIDPDNLKALALAGTAAFERKDFGAARGYWQKARTLAPAGSEFAAGLDRSLAEVGAPVQPAAAAPVGAGLTGRVSLAPGLAAQAAPTDTVFIFARAVDGPRMPLAILRRTVADLPFDFKLDDAMAMSPQMRLSNFDRVVVGARISRSGSAMPQPGDLRGESAATGNRTEGLQLTIDSVER